MDHAMLHQILIEAEARVRDSEDPAVKTRSQETVDLCLERLQREGLAREQLEAIVKGKR